MLKRWYTHKLHHWQENCNNVTFIQETQTVSRGFPPLFGCQTQCICDDEIINLIPFFLGCEVVTLRAFSHLFYFAVCLSQHSLTRIVTHARVLEWSTFTSGLLANQSLRFDVWVQIFHCDECEFCFVQDREVVIISDIQGFSWRPSPSLGPAYVIIYF